jgi:hypothetical protein
MRRSVSRAIGAALVALIMALCSTSPSLAFGGFHGGFGGFHPGFGGFHQGFRPGFVGFHPGFRPGFGGRRLVFHRGFFHNGGFINGWWGPALVTSAWWGGDSGCWAYRPTYDAAGNYLGIATSTCAIEPRPTLNWVA